MVHITIDVNFQDDWSPEARAAALEARRAHHGARAEEHYKMARLHRDENGGSQSERGALLMSQSKAPHRAAKEAHQLAALRHGIARDNPNEDDLHKKAEAATVAAKKRSAKAGVDWSPAR